MADTNPYARLGYLAIGEETTAGTAVKPSVYLELMSESIVSNYNIVPSTQIAGRIDVNQRAIKSTIDITGDITVLVEPKNLGHLLQNFFGAPQTTTIVANKVYQHTFRPSATLKTYTMDIKPADANYVRRYVSVYINSLAFSQVDNKIQLVLSVQALKAFDNARVTTTTASGTALHVDQTKGLTTSDTIWIIDKDDEETKKYERTVSAVNSETKITVNSAFSTSVDVDDIVVIKKSTPIYTASNDLIWIGGTEYGLGTGESAMYNTTTSDISDFTFTVTRELENRYAANGINLMNRMPTYIKGKGLRSEGSFSKVFENLAEVDSLRSNEAVGQRVRVYGEAIDTNSAATASCLIGTAGENNAFRATSSTSGDDYNNFTIRVIDNSYDTLVATKTGKNIVVKRASTDTTKNTATLVAAAVNGLSGVTAAKEGTGATEVDLRARTTFSGGRDANQREELDIMLPNTRFRPFGHNLGEDDLIMDEVSYDTYYDTMSNDSLYIRLTNDQSSY